MLYQDVLGLLEEMLVAKQRMDVLGYLDHLPNSTAVSALDNLRSFIDNDFFIVRSGSTLQETQSILDLAASSSGKSCVILVGRFDWSGGLTINDASNLSIVGWSAHIYQVNSDVDTITLTDCSNCIVRGLRIVGGRNAVTTLGGSGKVHDIDLEEATGVVADVDEGYPDPVLWLDASDNVSTTGNLVDSWTCKSNSDLIFTSSGDLRPTLVSPGINGLPVIRFSGTHRLSIADAVFVEAANTLAVVVQFNASDTSHQSILYQGNPSESNRYCCAMRRSVDWGYHARLYAFNTGVRAATGDIELTADVPSILMFKTNGDPYIDVVMKVNGVDDTVEQSAGVDTFGQIIGATHTIIGANLVSDSEVYPLTGDIAAIMGWDEILTATQLESVENYLSRRYGISV